MDFLIWDRASVESLTLDRSHLLVSIKDPHRDLPAFSTDPKRIRTIQYDFYDEDNESLQRQPIQQCQAQSVVENVNAIKETIDLIVVHREAGLCRSAAVGAALSKWLNGTDELFFKYYMPNMKVYRMVLEETQRLDKLTPDLP